VTIRIEVDGKTVTCEAGRTLVDVAAEAGVYIPTLCYLPEHPALGTCRVCSVKVNGAVAAPVRSRSATGCGWRSTNRRPPTRVKRWWRCCSPRATTTAPAVRRPAGARCRRSARGGHGGVAFPVPVP